MFIPFTFGDKLTPNNWKTHTRHHPCPPASILSPPSPTKLKAASKQAMSKWLCGTMKLLLLQEEWVYNTVADEILRFFYIDIYILPSAP